MTTSRSVTSVRGTRYVLDRKIGEGGQGPVYSVERQRLAVKLYRDRSQRSQEQLRDQLAMVGRLPLEDLHVARPLEQLRAPDVGYVMELVTGMEALSSLSHPRKGETSIREWYFATGGLRRRLKVLARLAEVFAELHGRGLIYVDASPGNVLVSSDPTQHEVRLIDTDNIRPSTLPGGLLFTPGYGAPEVVSGKGTSSSLSDAFSFAILAFEALALVHPFMGDQVHNGPPELEERALAGQLPWIDDPGSIENRSSHGIPREVVLSEHLRASFERTFGPGRTLVDQRVGIARWAEQLHRCADRIIQCPKCRGHYYYTGAACAWCGAGCPKALVCLVFLWDPSASRPIGKGELEAKPGIPIGQDGKDRYLDATSLALGDVVVLTERVTHGNSRRTPSLRVELSGERIALTALSENGMRLVTVDGKRERKLGAQPIEIAAKPEDAPWVLHCGPSDRLHRVLRFDVRRGTEA